jgi:hypothetical protein
MRYSLRKRSPTNYMDIDVPDDDHFVCMYQFFLSMGVSRCVCIVITMCVCTSLSKFVQIVNKGAWLVIWACHGVYSMYWD